MTDAAATRWIARAQRPPLAGAVEFRGYVRDEERPRLYRQARMLVLPSLEEGFGLPVLEAMACGVPVVVSDRGSLPEVAGDAATPVDRTTSTALAARDGAPARRDVARGGRSRADWRRRRATRGTRARRAARDAYATAIATQAAAR